MAEKMKLLIPRSSKINIDFFMESADVRYLRTSLFSQNERARLCERVSFVKTNESKPTLSMSKVDCRRRPKSQRCVLFVYKFVFHVLLLKTRTS